MFKHMRRSRKKSKKGFTLIELLIVVAIIAILAAIAIPQFSAYRVRAYNASAQSDLRNTGVVQGAISQDYSSYGVTSTGTLPGGGIAGVAVVMGPQGGASTTVSGAMLTTNELSTSNAAKALPIGVGSGVGIFADVSTSTTTIGTITATTGSSYTMITKHTLGNTVWGMDSDTTAIFFCFRDDAQFIGNPIGAATVPSAPTPSGGSNDFASIACMGDPDPSWAAK
jgi:type IV pilus assembly protein PilA